MNEDFFSHVIFLSLSEVSVAFNISSSYANAILPKRRFSHEQLLISKYLSVLRALILSQPHVLGFQT